MAMNDRYLIIPKRVLISDQQDPPFYIIDESNEMFILDRDIECQLVYEIYIYIYRNSMTLSLMVILNVD